MAVFSEYGMPQVRFVRGGTLDDPAKITPDVHIYTRSKVDWVVVPADTPAFDAYYEPKELWAPESRRRFQAAVRDIP